MPSPAAARFRIIRLLSLMGIAQGLLGMVLLSGVIIIADPGLKQALPLIGVILCADSLLLALVAWYLGNKMRKRFEAENNDPNDALDMRKQLAFVRFALIVGVVATAFLIRTLINGFSGYSHYESI